MKAFASCIAILAVVLIVAGFAHTDADLAAPQCLRPAMSMTKRASDRLLQCQRTAPGSARRTGTMPCPPRYEGGEAALRERRHHPARSGARRTPRPDLHARGAQACP